jgi:hypothetical protein
LNGKGRFNASINLAYIPLENEQNYISYQFENGEISFDEINAIDLGNFESNSLLKIKREIRKYFPNDSEKGLQAKYVVHSMREQRSNGFFIDSEFAYEKSRIDLVWIDLDNKDIAFVELKTKNDPRLYPERNQDQETINEQLEKYHMLIKENSESLVVYFNEIYQIKKDLGLLPKFANEDSIDAFRLIEKPILLVGDCSNEWIKQNACSIERLLKETALGAVYHGENTFNFNIPYISSRNNYRFHSDSTDEEK